MSGTKAENYESCDSDGVSVKKKTTKKKVQLVWWIYDDQAVP